jgi:hypothetical protein
VRGRNIAKADRIHIIFVVGQLENRLPRLEIIHDDCVVGSTSDNFAPVAGEAKTPYTEAGTIPVGIRPSRAATGRRRQVCEVKGSRVGGSGRVSRSKANHMSDGGVG